MEQPTGISIGSILALVKLSQYRLAELAEEHGEKMVVRSGGKSYDLTA